MPASKLALITGATSGIGWEIARELANRGWSIVATGRNEEKLVALGKMGAQTVAADLEREGAPEAIRAAIGERPLDMLVLSAGITQNARFDETSWEVGMRILTTNFLSQARLTHLLLPNLREAHGSILVISSITGLVGVPGRAYYSASKHALGGLFGAIRVENRGRVGVTIVCPGYVDTPIRRRALLGNGSVQGKDQAEGRKMLSADYVAKVALRAALKRKRLVVLGREAKLARILSCFSPGLLEYLLARYSK